MAQDKEKKKIRAIIPNYASYDIEYTDDNELKEMICSRFQIEPEFTNLIYLADDEEMTTMDIDDYAEDQEETEEKEPIPKVIVDYIWSRQMIALKDKQRKLRDAQVLVVGAGALGNDLVKNLSNLGIGRITLVDFDVIEFSNISRGLFEKEDMGKSKAEVLAQKMGRSSPYVKFKAISKRVEECKEEDLKCDVIISALDNMPTRVWLSSFAVRWGIPLIDGGIKEFTGRVQTYLPGKACIACNIPLDRYAEIMELRNPCEGVEFGAQASFTTISSIIAGIQANEAMKIIAGLPTLDGVLLMDFLNNKYSRMDLERNPSCFVCGSEDTKSVSVDGYKENSI